MSIDFIYVIGAGGHAKVVVDALLAAGVARERLRVSDNNPALAGASLCAIAVEVPAVRPEMRGGLFHIALGSAQARQQLHAQLAALGARPWSVIHPRAVVSPSSSLGAAVFIAANAVIGPGARLADGVIINHGAVVDHDCCVGAFSHVASNATLGGAVRVGAQVLVGAGANVLPQRKLGDNAVVGAGAVVINNVPAAQTHVGVPAVFLLRNEVINVLEISVVDTMPVSEALSILDKSAAGILLLTHPDGVFKRTVTDGDLRRLLLKSKDFEQPLAALAPIDSIVVDAACSRSDALTLMNKHRINHLPVVDGRKQIVGLIERSEIDRQILLSTPHLGDAEQGFVHQAFETNWIAPLGPNVDAFEAELATFVGAKHATAVSSGTAAIHLALVLLGVGSGDTVFCSTLTFAASANPIVYQGAKPVFIDSDEASWNMSVAALERALAAAATAGKLPKAVIVVNLYGQSADMDPLSALCERYGVPIIEDAAESLGALYKGRASGTFGKLGIYSFNGNKIITTSGGGMLLSDDPSLMARAKFLATQARDPAPHYEHSVIGYNYRMSNILAGVGRGQLGVLTERVEARREVFARYKAALGDISALQWMPEPEWSYSTHWLSVCLIDPARSAVTGKELIQSLADELIEARPVWKPMHLQPVFQDCEYFTDGVSSVSDRLFERGICLPSGSNMAVEDIDRIIEVIRKTMQA